MPSPVNAVSVVIRSVASPAAVTMLFVTAMVSVGLVKVVVTYTDSLYGAFDSWTTFRVPVVAPAPGANEPPVQGLPTRVIPVYLNTPSWLETPDTALC